MTGEIPQTLSTLVDRIQSKYMHYFMCDFGSKLDVRNQVCDLFSWNVIMFWCKETKDFILGEGLNYISDIVDNDMVVQV